MLTWRGVPINSADLVALRVTAQKEAKLAEVKAAFMRKLLHEIRTPCHVVSHTLSLSHTHTVRELSLSHKQ